MVRLLRQAESQLLSLPLCPRDGDLGPVTEEYRVGEVREGSVSVVGQGSDVGSEEPTVRAQVEGVLDRTPYL